MDTERYWEQAAERSWVVRSPKQHLATFGSTSLSYYVVTEPVYHEFQPGKDEGVVRTGRVIAERPSIVTPYYAMHLQGFSSGAYDYFRHMARQYGANSPGILYQYRNEVHGMEIVGGLVPEIAHRISGDLDRRSESMAVVMVGVDEMWDVALLKFIYEFTSRSAASNVQELRARGLLDPQEHLGGVPRAAVKRIDELFREVEGGRDPEDLRCELDRWGVFDQYQDRFLSLFNRRR